MNDTPKVCTNCEYAIEKPVWLFFNRWYCRNPAVRSVFNPIHGRSVECHEARHSNKSPCGPTANCYDGPANFKPDPNRPMTYASSGMITASMLIPTGSAFHRPSSIVYNNTNVPSSGYGGRGGGGVGGFLPGMALGYILGHNNDSPTPAAEPWSGGGGEANGGGTSDSWDSGSDGDSSDSGGDGGGSDD